MRGTRWGEIKWMEWEEEEEEGRSVTNERSGSRERGSGVGVKGSVKGKGTF